jgi:hypothetical protein
VLFFIFPPMLFNTTYLIHVVTLRLWIDDPCMNRTMTPLDPDPRFGAVNPGRGTRQRPRIMWLWPQGCGSPPTHSRLGKGAVDKQLMWQAGVQGWWSRAGRWIGTKVSLHKNGGRQAMEAPRIPRIGGAEQEAESSWLGGWASKLSQENTPGCCCYS